MVERNLPTGTQINYYFICLTKLWLFSHNIELEPESDLVGIGRHIHETSYSRERKNVMIDGRISIDFMQKRGTLTVHEVKKSRIIEDAHRYQLCYYLYYLQYIKGILNPQGILDYPLLKHREEIQLTPEIIYTIESAILDIQRVVAEPKPPEPERKKICGKCAYFEFCWV